MNLDNGPGGIYMLVYSPINTYPVFFGRIQAPCLYIQGRKHLSSCSQLSEHLTDKPEKKVAVAVITGVMTLWNQSALK